MAHEMHVEAHEVQDEARGHPLSVMAGLCTRDV